MKSLNYLLSAAVLVFLLANASCKSDDDPGVPAADQVGAKFTSTWNASSVTFGSPSQDRSADYSDFQLTIGYTAGTNAGTYSITGGPQGSGIVPFAGNGTWSFQNEITDANPSSFNIVRNDGLVITVSSLTDTSLQLSFVFDDGTHSSSRTEAVDGTWTFDFSK
ncbi:hypothetical protein [Fulvivirga sp.]|uniref:hypothetical protein n=1 Tax=Fulvivirga sp. TaxID=1931237 RepID=UPI0032ECD00E